ncbi:MAG: hypothetical protein AABW73_04215 [Nanoarchaeota archaeon]
MITYNDIYEALRKERYSEQLQTLTKKFLRDIAEYFDDKKKSSEKEESLSGETSSKGKKQLENAISMFKELMLRRKKKILNLVFIAAETGLSKRDFENLLPFEKSLFEKIMDSVEISDRELKEIMKGSEEVTTLISKENMLIVFKEDIEEFLDLEGNKTGPFAKGEIASINSDIAKILIGGGKAENVEGNKEE